MDTGICIEDVVQTLIDLRLAHTGKSLNDTNLKQLEGRNRRRQQNPLDNNNNTLDPSSVLIIDSDALRSALGRLSSNNLLSKQSQHVFDPKYLRLTNRR